MGISRNASQCIYRSLSSLSLHQLTKPPFRLFHGGPDIFHHRPLALHQAVRLLSLQILSLQILSLLLLCEISRKSGWICGWINNCGCCCKYSRKFGWIVDGNHRRFIIDIYVVVLLLWSRQIQAQMDLRKVAREKARSLINHRTMRSRGNQFVAG